MKGYKQLTKIQRYQIESFLDSTNKCNSFLTGKKEVS